MSSFVFGLVLFPCFKALGFAYSHFSTLETLLKVELFDAYRVVNLSRIDVHPAVAIVSLWTYLVSFNLC